MLIILVVLFLAGCDNYDIEKAVSYCADKGGIKETGNIYVKCHNGEINDLYIPR